MKSFQNLTITWLHVRYMGFRLRELSMFAAEPLNVFHTSNTIFPRRNINIFSWNGICSSAMLRPCIFLLFTYPSLVGLCVGDKEVRSLHDQVFCFWNLIQNVWNGFVVVIIVRLCMALCGHTCWTVMLQSQFVCCLYTKINPPPQNLSWHCP
jgi:hypothetical protein